MANVDRAGDSKLDATHCVARASVLLIPRSVFYMQTIFRMPILLLFSALLLVARGAEETALVNEGKINVRGQPSLVGEVVTQLQRGDQVTVLEYVKNERAKAGE